MCLFGMAAPPAMAAGAPELFAQAGYLTLRESIAEEDDSVVLERVSRVSPATGRIAATVNVLALVDSTYVRRRLDSIQLAVRCDDVLWFQRATFADGNGSGTVTHRLYRVTATEAVQVTTTPIGFEGRDLECGPDGSAYVRGTGFDGVDASDYTLRLAPEGPVTTLNVPGGFLVTRDGLVTFDARAGRATIHSFDGSSRRTVRVRNRQGLRRGGELASDGDRLYVIEPTGNGPGWVRPFSARGRGQYFDGLSVTAAQTQCGGLVITRAITLSRTEVLFLRAGRVVRRVASQARPVELDQRAGTVALLGRVYRACGSRAGQVRTRLRGGVQATRMVGSRASG